MFKNNTFLNGGTLRIHVVLYLDAFEIVNPLGSARNKHKLMAVYYTIGNLHTFSRSKLNAMQLVLLCKEKLIIISNQEHLFEPLINDLKKLETVGIDIGLEESVKGTVVLITRGGVEDTRLEAKAKDTKKIRGQGQGQPFQGQTLSRPRTGMLEAKAKDQGHKAQVLSKKKKKKRSSQKIFRRSPEKKKKKRSSQKFFKRSPLKNVFQKIFQALHKILTFQKIVLSSSRGQANFRGLEASRPRPRPRTSKSVLEDVLEAKDVLEDSTSADNR